jgi:hypothetical protein
MKRLLIVLVVLLLAPTVYAAGYQTITWYNYPNLTDAVGQEVIPDECGTASSWGTTGNYKLVETYNCDGTLVTFHCYRWLFGQWYPQYCY